MSKDVPARVDALFRCPFCGEPTWTVEVTAPRWIDTKKREIITFKIECLGKAPSSADTTCPAMSETGCYYLFLRPDGSGHASYF